MYVQAVLAVFLYVGSAEIVQRSALFNTKENVKVFAGDMIKRHRSQSFVSCTQMCLSEPLCASFNYDSSPKSRGFCELYKDGEGVELINEVGWVCGHLLNKQQFVKRKYNRVSKERSPLMGHNCTGFHKRKTLNIMFASHCQV